MAVVWQCGVVVESRWAQRTYCYGKAALNEAVGPHDTRAGVIYTASHPDLYRGGPGRASEAVSEEMTMRKFFAICAFASVLGLASCSNKAANQPQATIQLRDGTSLTGAVTGSSPTAMTVVDSTNTKHEILMSQVKSIEYSDAASGPEQTAAVPIEPQTGKPASAGATKKPAPRDTAEHENHYHPRQAEIQTKTYQLSEGTEIPVRTEDTIDSGKAAEGQTYAAEIADDVRDADGNVVIPRESNAQIVIKSASKGGKIRGASDLVLDLKSITVEGQEYLVSTTDLQQQGKSGFGLNKRTGEYTGGGAAIGAIIGAIAGGGKGAAIGAGAGAGGGALTQVLTKGGAIQVPAETVLTFKLDMPVRVVAAK